MIYELILNILISYNIDTTLKNIEWFIKISIDSFQRVLSSESSTCRSFVRGASKIIIYRENNIFSCFANYTVDKQCVPYNWSNRRESKRQVTSDTSKRLMNQVVESTNNLSKIQKFRGSISLFDELDRDKLR